MRTILVSIFLTTLVVTSARGGTDVPFNGFRYESIGEMPDPTGVAGPLAGVDNDALILAGGANFPEAPPWKGGVKKYYSDVYVALRNKDGTLRWIGQDATLPKPMGYAAVTDSSRGVVCLGGETTEGPIDDALLIRFDPAVEKVVVSSLPSLPEPTTAAAAAVLGGRVYLLGGLTKSGFSNKMYSIALAGMEKIWRTEPELPVPTAYAVAVSQSDGEKDRIYLLGGRARADGEEAVTFYDTVRSFDPRSRSWRMETPMPRPLAAGTGASLGVSSIFFFGGDDGVFFNDDRARAAALEAQTDPVEKEKRRAEKIRFQEEHRGFRREILCYNTITKTWVEVFRLPEERSDLIPVTTVAVPWGGDIVIPAGEARPGVRTPNIHLFRVTGQTHFTTIDFAILGLYMTLMLGIGFLFLRKESTTGDFFLGGGRLPWWAVGISIFATTLSAITFLSMPAKAYAADWRMFPYNFGILLVAPIIIRFYLPYFRKMNLHTAYEYLEWRFNRVTRLFASGLFVFFMISRTAIVLYLPSLALNVATGLDVNFCIILMALVTITYCTFGGMEAVVWGDVVQGFILVAGALASLITLVLRTDGGFFGFLEQGLASGKMHVFDLRFDCTQTVFWVVIIGSFANNMITYSNCKRVSILPIAIA